MKVHYNTQQLIYKQAPSAQEAAGACIAGYSKEVWSAHDHEYIHQGYRDNITFPLTAYNHEFIYLGYRVNITFPLTAHNHEFINLGYKGQPYVPTY